MTWLKLKKDYIKGGVGGDTIDLIPIGGYYGKGKRKGIYGSFLMACQDKNDAYHPICKLGSGLSDVFLNEVHAELSPKVKSLIKKILAFPIPNVCKISFNSY